MTKLGIHHVIRNLVSLSFSWFQKNSCMFDLQRQADKHSNDKTCCTMRNFVCLDLSWVRDSKIKKKLSCAFDIRGRGGGPLVWPAWWEGEGPAQGPESVVSHIATPTRPFGGGRQEFAKNTSIEMPPSSHPGDRWRVGVLEGVGEVPLSEAGPHFPQIATTFRLLDQI